MNSAISLSEAFKAFAKIGILSFGGPAGQIALMHRVIVDEKRWLSEQQFLNALSFCMLLPGPEAMQLATYAGWRLHGTLGGLIAGLLFVLPGAFVIMVLAATYALVGDVPLVTAIFLGVKAAVVVIVIEALVKVSKRALKRFDYWVVAALAFIGIFFLALPFPFIIVIAALYGAVRIDTSIDDVSPVEKVVSSRTFKAIGLWLVIWWAPLLALWGFAPDSVLSDIGFFFSKLAVVSFGGAYAGLAYMAQDVVSGFGWLQAGEMMDGLGLAETTPGPLILVTEFVGFLAAFKQGGLALGVAGGIVTLWVTFAPCFLCIFAGAPYVEWISSQPRLRGALTGITAAVVGVILNLTVWFALHVFFAATETKQIGVFKVLTPDIASLDWRVLVLSIVSCIMLLVLHRGILVTLAVAAGLAVAMHFLGFLLYKTGSG
ncbi:MAG: chromate efflux transporter [Hyphomicrobiales bacterium]